MYGPNGLVFLHERIKNITFRLHHMFLATCALFLLVWKKKNKNKNKREREREKKKKKKEERQGAKEKKGTAPLPFQTVNGTGRGFLIESCADRKVLSQLE